MEKGKEILKPMATLSFTSVRASPQPRVFHSSNTKLRLKRRANSLSFAVNSPESSPSEPEKPEIELEFMAVSRIIWRQSLIVSNADSNS